MTLSNSGMGSPDAATGMDLLVAIKPQAALLPGTGGGVKKNKVGELVLPIAAIRGSPSEHITELPSLGR